MWNKSSQTKFRHTYVQRGDPRTLDSLNQNEEWANFLLRLLPNFLLRLLPLLNLNRRTRAVGGLRRYPVNDKKFLYRALTTKKQGPHRAGKHLK